METNRYDAYREDRAGRANVADSPERVAYYQELARLETGALWTVANKIEPWAPRSASVPVVWRYQDLRGHVRSAELVSPEEAGRRVIYLNNPGRRDVAAAVGWLYSGLQVMKPGELASAHAHAFRAALHHGRQRRIHHRRRPQDDAGRERLRAHAQRHLARARRVRGRHHLHLAGRPGHPAGQRAGSRLLCRASGPEPGRHVSGRRHHRHLGGVALRPQASGWTKPYCRCSNTNGSPPTRRCAATRASPRAARMTACCWST